MQQFSELDLYYLNLGEHTNLYDKFGAHIIKKGNKILGVQFRVYAPNARQVYVIGEFNNWQKTHQMIAEVPGVFSLYIADIKSLSLYKYILITNDNKEIVKADPYAFFSELRPGTASSTYNFRYKFKDDIWMNNRVNYDFTTQPVSIYELHLGSWQQKHLSQKDQQEDKVPFYTYKELAVKIIDYVKQHHFTHIELMPIMEHPLDASWGYQITGYYSATSRYGKPDDLKYFIDQCHQAGIGVILDWVPLHFCKDEQGLALFDGTTLYEYPLEHDYDNQQWGTINFDLSKGLTRSFLLSNIKFWLENYHFDGIRVDALSYLLYWRGETEQSKVNYPAVEFIKRVNALVHTEFKGVMMIGEDSSNYPKVTHSFANDGLEFDMKWDLGWMNDTLKYFSRPAMYRSHHSNEITFSMYYNYQEKYILPLSHDEVVHGKLSIVNKMNGNYEDKFHQLRCYYSYMYAHPGKKLLFMGNEWGHVREWHEHTSMDWLLLDYPQHKNFNHMMRVLLCFYKDNDALWQKDYQKEGFKWVNIDIEANLYAFLRSSEHQQLLIVNNFNDQQIFDKKLNNLSPQSSYKLVYSSNHLPIDEFIISTDDNGSTNITIPRYTTYYLELQ